MRGKLGERIYRPVLSGITPRVRGKLCPELLVEVTRGITPACAGKTIACASASVLTRDHPRVCGENYVEWEREPDKKGSPPRMRGKRHA